MSKFKKIMGSPEVMIALATGISIIVMAVFSKHVLPKPIGYLPLAIPPFIATIYEVVVHKHKGSRICRPWYWVAAILAVTALVIALNM